MRWNDNSFEAYYKRELAADIMRQPKTIDTAALQPRKEGDEQFENTSQRKETFYKEHGLYLENKKE